MIRILLGLSLIPTLLFAQATDDNEVWIDQTGDTLTLYIDQIGFGNKIGLNDFSGTAELMTITGSSLTFDLDFIGNQNILYGPLVSDSSTFNLSFTGDSNITDWNIGYIGSTDDSTWDITVTGDSNDWDIDQGYVASAERLDLDLTLIGSSNIFDLDFESDDNTWNWDLTGDSNNINVLMNDGSHTQNVSYSGDSGDIDINQISGTCATGAGTSCSTPNGNIQLDITSDNATIQINQKDSSNDS
tara:strand:- start:398 stop:1129 length:732 start_codon:yes stop_codon:yes gene_type:complete